MIPHRCPQSTCITVRGMKDIESPQPLPFSMDISWIEIRSMRDWVATNRSDTTSLTPPRWNQRFCFPPSPIALCTVMASNLLIAEDTPSGSPRSVDAVTISEKAFGKFHVSPLTEGPIARKVHLSPLLAELEISVSIEVDISLSDWEGEGVYNPSDYVSRSIRSTVSSHDGTADLLFVEADRLKWIGYVGQPMTVWMCIDILCALRIYIETTMMIRWHCERSGHCQTTWNRP